MCLPPSPKDQQPRYIQTYTSCIFTIQFHYGSNLWRTQRRRRILVHSIQWWEHLWPVTQHCKLLHFWTSFEWDYNILVIDRTMLKQYHSFTKPRPCKYDITFLGKNILISCTIKNKCSYWFISIWLCLTHNTCISGKSSGESQFQVDSILSCFEFYFW